MAALILIGALEIEPDFWDDVAAVRANTSPVNEAWARASRYGTGARGRYARRREVIARMLLAPAAVPPNRDRERLALYGLATAGTWVTNDDRGDRGSYLIGRPFVEPLALAAAAIAAARTGQDPDDGATASRVRRLFELAAPVVVAGPGLSASWDDDLDELRAA